MSRFLQIGAAEGVPLRRLGGEREPNRQSIYGGFKLRGKRRANSEEKARRKWRRQLAEAGEWLAVRCTRAAALYLTAPPSCGGSAGPPYEAARPIMLL